VQLSAPEPTILIGVQFIPAGTGTLGGGILSSWMRVEAGGVLEVETWLQQ